MSSNNTVEYPSRRRFRPGVAATAVALVLGVSAIYSSTFVVEPSERGAVRVFGKVMSEAPLLPGPHLKIPFVSTVDRAQVSLTNLHVPVFPVNTIDNQKIDLEINLTYRIPDSAVFHLLYEIGESGSGDITHNIIPIVQDRVGRVFSARNTNLISEGREAIQAEAQRNTRDALRDIFRVELDTLQISKIGYSASFVASNERSVTAKNEAIAEENRVRVSEFQAKQGIAIAQGKAEQARAEAQGDADAIRIRASANKESVILQGQATAARFRSEIDAAGGVEPYVRVVVAQGQAKWDGRGPTTLVGTGTAPAMLVPVADVSRGPSDQGR